ncbi:hypothetical protein ACVIGB_000911 [Bradyrhizobium sp. USDA 4341]
MASPADSDRRKAPLRLPDSARELARWENRGETVIAEVQQYGQTEILAIRRWYPTEEGLMPGRSGMSFGVAELSELAATVEAARRAIDKGYVSPAPQAAPAPPAAPGSANERPPLRPRPPSPPLHRSGLSSPASRAPQGDTPLAGASERTSLPQPAVGGGDVARARRAASIEGTRPVGATLHDLGAARPTEPPPAELPVGPRDRTGVTLAAIIAKGLASAPLALRIKTRQGVVSGVAYRDGTIVFGNRRFRSPREAYCTVTGQRHVVDAWQRITCRNPSTQRFAKLSRLRNLYLGLEEDDNPDDEQ